MADPRSVSIVIPACNEAAAIADVVAALARGRALARDHRRRRRLDRRHGARAPRPPAHASCGIRTTRATAPRSRAASARATGEYILIIDGDGQHQPADALRLVVAARRVRPRRRRAIERDAGDARRAGSATRALNRLASYLTEREIPDLTSGFRARAARVPARVPAPAAERLLDADDDDAGVPQGGLQRDVRADRGAAARRARRRSGWRATAPKFLLIMLRDHDDLQPAAGLPADQRRVVRARRRLRASGRSSTQRARHQLVGAADHVRGRSCFSSGWCPSRSPRCASKAGNSRCTDRDAAAG